MPRAFIALAAVSFLSISTSAQVVSLSKVRAPSLDTLPVLPAIAPDSPRTSLLFADRIQAAPAVSIQSASNAVLVDTYLSPSLTGTGYGEPIQYQVPDNYASSPQARPLLVAYHGFGASDGSVAMQSTLDEMCDQYGWLYLAPTGLDDKLFGSEACQRHIETAIEWMIDNTRVDEDRIYMVGFSMGAGVVSSFASRHRNSDGLSIAAVGLVSGSFDWALSHAIDPALQPWLEHPLNFGSAPAGALLDYRRAGGLAFTSGSFPPFPGTYDEDFSLAAVNLANIPTFITWDTTDPLIELPSQSSTLVSELRARGGVAVSAPVTATLDGAGLAAPHSWAVLDETALFTFLDGRVADRSPSSFAALVDEPRTVAWLDITPAEDSFALVEAEADLDLDQVTLSNVSGAARIVVDGASLGLEFPTRILASGANATHWDALVRGEIGSVTDSSSGQGWLLPEYSGAGDAAGARVPAFGAVDFTTYSTEWGSSLTALPDPILPGETLELSLVASPGTTTAVLIVGMADGLVTFPNGTQLNIALTPPIHILSVPLNANGTFILSAPMPQSEPSVSGFRFLLQALAVDPQTSALTSSNPIALDVN